MGAADRHDEDAELVRRTLANEPDAFAQLYEQHRDGVYRLAYHFVHNTQDALDLCQEIFVRAFESLPSFQGRSRFRTWLMRIASNTCIDFVRQAKVRRAGELDEHTTDRDQRVPGGGGPPEPSRGPEQEEMRAAIDAAVAQLSADHRAVFLLHAVEGMTYQEIAEAVDCPVGTVMSRLHYARKRLQGLLAWLKKDEAR